MNMIIRGGLIFGSVYLFGIFGLFVAILLMAVWEFIMDKEDE